MGLGSAGDPFAPHRGGRRLGDASGRITIDTSDAERAEVTMRRVGRNVAQAVRPMQTELRNLNRDLGSVRGELIAIGAAGGLISKIGYQGARTVRSYQVGFRVLLGSQTQAVRLMGELTESADEFGINFEEAWQLARALLPTLEGNTEELDKFVTRAALLASTNPLKGTTDAARAIQEYLSGQTISLQRLFNVDPNLIREAQEQFEGVGDQLDYILQRMGATEAGAREMADAFVGVRNELRLALAEGFTPLFQQLQPGARALREFTQELRANNPEVLQLGAGLAAVAAVGAPTLLVLNQLITSAAKLRNLGAIGSAALAAGGAGIAAAAGVGVGLAGTRAIGRATGSEELAGANLRLLAQRLGEILFVAIDTFSKINVLFATGMAKLLQLFTSGVAAMIRVMGRFVAWVADLIPGRGPADDAGERLQRFADKLDEVGSGALQRFVDDVLEGRRRMVEDVGAFLFPNVFQRPDFDTERANLPPFRSGTAAPQAVTDFSEEERQAVIDYYDDVQQIEEDAREQRLQATREYEQQRTQIIAEYERGLAREVEDFTRQRAREEADLQASVAEVRASAAESEIESTRDYNQRVARLTEDHQRRLLQIQRDYDLRILDAARNLNAGQVASLQRERDQRLGDERENLGERYEQEREAHEERIALARDAEREQIRDLEESLRQRQRREDEDRRIRLQRQAEDHRRQLTMLEQANLERLNQIAVQMQRELTQREAAFVDELRQLDGYWADRLDEQHRWQDREIQAFAKYLRRRLELQEEMLSEAFRFAEQNPEVRHRAPFASYQTGTSYVPRTGPYLLHREEAVLDPRTAGLLRGMFGGAFSGPQLVAALAGAGGSQTSMTINMPIYGAPGQDARSIGVEVEQTMLRIFKGLGRS